MSEEPRLINEYDTANGTHTQYLVIYGTGAVTCDVHETIDRVVADADLEPPHKILGIMLIVNDGQRPVWVQVESQAAGEWEIGEAGGDTNYEYVFYSDPDRTNCEIDQVYVDGFPEEPSYPQLVETD